MNHARWPGVGAVLMAFVGCSTPSLPEDGAQKKARPTANDDAGATLATTDAMTPEPPVDAGTPEAAPPKGFAISSALHLSQASTSAGQTVTGTVTYTNYGVSSVAVQAGAIAARPPGGTHAGGPFDDFAPYATATTVAPGGSFTVSASRTFTGAAPLGSWDVYPTYQDGSGTWHDGPDQTLKVTGATSTGQSDAGSTAPLVPSPLTGSVTTGTWQSGTINGMSYQYLMPAGYTTAYAYPLVLYLHQLDNASQIPAQIDPWFNDVAYRTQYPSIVVAPQCDQSADPSGNTINWGGVSTADQPCQDDAMALVAQFMATTSVYAPKVYVTGNSMGGIGSWDAIIKFNTRSPTVRPVFAAALILAGATYDWGYPTPDPSVVAALEQVPIWAIHGQQDTQVPLQWDDNMYAAQQAAGGLMKLTVDPNLAHDVWDTYYVIPTSETYWSWLFTQSE